MIAALTFAAAIPAKADSSNGYVTDHGVLIYYAIVPAEMIRGHAKDHPEATMHGGIPNEPHVHHLMVALFDGKSMDRIVDAKVKAMVGEIGLGGPTKNLEPFVVAGALTYGNFFELRPNQEYEVRIEAKVPRQTQPATVTFRFNH